MEKKNFLLLPLIGLLMISCSEKKETEKDVIPVETETVGQSAADGSQQYVGTVVEESGVACSFTTSGTLTKVCVDEGQHVSKGQLIATIDPTQAKNMLTAAQAQMKQAKDALARMKQLHDTKSLSDMKWVETQSQVEQAQAQLQLAERNVKDCSLYAPVSGYVGKKTLSTGETALPSEPVVSILNINKVKVKVAIPEKENSLITTATTKGKGVKITVDALGGQTFYSHQFEKGVEGDAMTHTYNVWFYLDNPGEKLLPGMVCNVSLNTGLSALDTENSSTSTITVPVRSVQETADGKLFVWTLKGDKAYRTIITVGETIGNRIVVTSGLSMGMKVITAGYQKVSQGSTVREQNGK